MPVTKPYSLGNSAFLVGGKKDSTEARRQREIANSARTRPGATAESSGRPNNKTVESRTRCDRDSSQATNLRPNVNFANS